MPQDLADHPFIGHADKAVVLRTAIANYLERCGIRLITAQQVDNPAKVTSLVASTRELMLIPAYVESLMPWSVVSRRLAGETPRIELVAGYSKANASPVLALFLSRLDGLITRVAQKRF